MGMCKFVRVPRAFAGQPVTMWQELDADGAEAGSLRQLECRCDTRWLWWAGALYQRAASMSNEREYILMSALSVAGAYSLLDFAWLSSLVGGRFGPNPIMLLFLVLAVGGAVIAAAVPLRESTLLLYNPATRTEVRLNQRQGFTRDPSNVPGRVNAWVPVCEGAWEELPPELKAQHKERKQHVVFIALVALACAWGVAKRRAGGWELPPEQVRFVEHLEELIDGDDPEHVRQLLAELRAARERQE